MSRPCSILAGALGVPQQGWGQGLLEGCMVLGRAPEVLEGGARVGLGLQAPVGGVEEEYQAAAQEGAQAGHRQHGYWGDTAAGLRPGHGASPADPTDHDHSDQGQIPSQPSCPKSRSQMLSLTRSRGPGATPHLSVPSALCLSVCLPLCLSLLSLSSLFLFLTSF